MRPLGDLADSHPAGRTTPLGNVEVCFTILPLLSSLSLNIFCKSDSFVKSFSSLIFPLSGRRLLFFVPSNPASFGTGGGASCEIILFEGKRTQTQSKRLLERTFLVQKSSKAPDICSFGSQHTHQDLFQGKKVRLTNENGPNLTTRLNIYKLKVCM